MTGANWAGLGLNVGQTSEQLSAAVICGDQTLGCDSATDVGMEDFSLVAFVLACLTQGGAGTRTARACLPWAMMCNAVGVRAASFRLSCPTIESNVRKSVWHKFLSLTGKRMSFCKAHHSLLARNLSSLAVLRAAGRREWEVVAAKVVALRVVWRGKLLYRCPCVPSFPWLKPLRFIVATR